MGNKKCSGCCLCKTLVIIGALNWGLVGAFDYNLVDALLGAWPAVVRTVYILVGLAGVMALLCMAKGCKKCCGSSCSTPSTPMGGSM